MPKYKPADELKVKQSIIRLQRKVADLEQRKEELAKDIVELDKGARSKTIVLQRREQNLLLNKAEDALAQREAQHQAAVAALREEEATLQRSVQQLSGTLEAFRSEIRRIATQPVVDPTTYLRSVSDALTQALDGLATQYEVKKEAHEDLDQQIRSAEVAMQRLEADKAELTGHIDELEAKLTDAGEDFLKTNKALAEARKGLEAIEKRERDSRVMMRRLSEDYQRVYRQLPRREQ